MPNPALSAAIAEAYASAPTEEVILDTLELRHPSFTTPIRVVNDHVDLVATLEPGAPVDGGQPVTFSRFAFRFKLPDVGTSGVPEIEIEIDNLAPEIVGYIDAAAQTDDLVEVTYRPFLGSDTSAPQMDPPLTMILHDVEADVFIVRGTAKFGDFGNRRFPNEMYTQQRFPGLTS